jgi:hypothetical protein
MHIRYRPETAAAILLGGIAVLHGLLGGSGGASLLRSVEPALPAPESSAGQALHWCRANVAIIHDVYWASTCQVVAEEQRRRGPAGGEPPDDSTDCTLPDQRAQPLNLARAIADQQCLDEARAMARP